MSAAPPARRTRHPDGSAAGQTIAMLVTLLLSLPLLPFALVVVAVVRVRDRLASIAARRSASPQPLSGHRSFSSSPLTLGAQSTLRR